MKKPKVHKAQPHYLTPGWVRPKLRERQRLGATVLEAQCPRCGTFRPGFCICHHPQLGTACDGCISAARRAGELDDAPELVDIGDSA